MKIFQKIEQEGEYTALLKNLLKTFNCLPHNLMIAKLRAQILDKVSLRHAQPLDKQALKSQDQKSLQSLEPH